MTIRFDGKVAVVTGAGHGIGREHALGLAARGAKVVVNDLGGARDGTGASATAAQAVVDEIVAAGGEAVANTDSVADPEGGKRIVEQAMDTWGRLDIAICNAGILRDRSFAKMTLDDFRAVMDVHVMGSVHVCHAAWPHMRAQQYGRIVLTTSVSGLFGNFGQANYGAAKMALVGLMNTLKIEGRKYNIHTNCIARIAMTRMTEDILAKGQQERFPPRAVTPAVLFLSSEQAPNGVIVQAAGGRYYVAAIVENSGVDLGPDATPEQIAERFDDIRDLSDARTVDK
ncbi:MAG: SDR family NAD(P)-dependent oxidoreductase [Candidatus Dadabacteria bacterium]|nr:MAG: SDR family NAD(P)-dependent oxidoreductase [Candidatus Dadabacteria bacterium]